MGAVHFLALVCSVVHHHANYEHFATYGGQSSRTNQAFEGGAEIHDTDEQHMADCNSYMSCSVTAPMRGILADSMKSFHQLVPERVMDVTGGDGRRQQLLVPIRKPLFEGTVADGDLSSLPWPARMTEEHTPWQLIPEGEYFHECARNSSVQHIYCKHFRDYKTSLWEEVIRKHYKPIGMFEIPSTRLILDISGGPGHFARALQTIYGDRLVTLTTNAHMHTLEGRTPPYHQLLAARGFLTATLDMYAAFPFGESTFDVVHSSWAYHTGYPRTALLEMYRVVRPGGWIVLRQWTNPLLNRTELAYGLPRVLAVAKALGWALRSSTSVTAGMNHGQDHLVAFQVPTFRY